ncbi:MAG: ferric reductase-like transmembrane domain-containing protein [Theionarchaea archaeon]|nr:ferric reductase-like transmembrane domain-containing protein [Theionarchaea archaeon]
MTDGEHAGQMKKSHLWGLLAAIMAVPLAYWVADLSFDAPWNLQLYALGRILALEAFVLFLCQFILSSKIKVLERGMGLDRLLIIHRRLGKIGIFLILLHPFFLFSFTASQGFSGELALRALGLVDAQFSGPRSYGPLTIAIIILSGFILVSGTAILYGKIRLGYETWRKIHYLTYALIPLAFAHSTILGSDLQGGILMYYWYGMIIVYLFVLSHRIWKRSSIRGKPYKVTSVEKVSHDVWNLGFEGPEIEHKPGQFMILQLKRKDKVSEAHPFTISSSPGKKPSVTVKSVGDFTSTIGETEISDTAYIDAPYGVFSFMNFEARDLVFIAGGIGITPFLSMLRYMRDAGLDRKVTLIWGNKTQEDIIFKEEIEALVDQLPSFKLVHVLSMEEDWTGERGLIDKEVLKRHVDDFEHAEFFVCGPPPMNALVEGSLQELGVSKDRIHDERFSLR